jgi:glycosyltransferase involved in cell wall biosynthesis
MGACIRLGTLLNRLAHNGCTIRALDPISPKPPENVSGYTWRFHARVRLLDQYKCSYFTTASDPGSAADRRRYAAYMEDLLPRLVAEDRPDLILIGSEYFVFGLAEFAKRLAIPAVLASTGPFAAYFRGVLPKGVGQELLAVASQVDMIVACADHMGQDLRAAGLDNVEVVQNFVDTEMFTDGTRDNTLLQQLDINDDDIVVLHVSNLTPPKRILDVAGAARLALQRDPRLVFIVAGDGPDREAFEAACARDGTAVRFRFVGWIDRDRMPAFYRIGDVVVLPSETEGLALTYLETQACGRVICASDIPAAREVIAHDDTGLLFRMGDVPDLTDKILHAVRDDALRARIGASAQAFVRRHHSVDNAVAKYEGLFERLLTR